VHVPDTIQKQVGFLCIDERAGKKIVKTPVGTCFFVCVHNHQRNCVFGYLITAKHVWEAFRDKRPSYVRLNKFKVKAGESGVIYIPLPRKGWVFHQDPAVDLAVLPWAADTGPANYSFVYTEFGEIAKTEETMKKEGLPWPPKEGEDVIHVGLMIQYAGFERNFALVRRGHVALMTNEPVEGTYGLSNYHFIDLQSYPGHSGGPVWVIYPTKETGITMFLLGVLVGAYPEPQEMVRLKKSGRKVEHYNLGISLVVPNSKLIEIINSPEMEDMRKRDEPKPVKPVPVMPSSSQQSTSRT